MGTNVNYMISGKPLNLPEPVSQSVKWVVLIVSALLLKEITQIMDGELLLSCKM